MRRILFVFGTRPEAIKLAPVIEELKADRAFEVKVCVTGQHREMLDQVLDLFGIEPDFRLDLMQRNQALTDLSAGVLAGLPGVFRDAGPDLVVVQGDTTSAFAGALAAFYEHIGVAHVEAGLRTGDPASPWPEEVNRRLLSVIARCHFAPTEDAAANLRREGADAASIHVTGNTVVDALRRTLGKIECDEALRERIESQFRFIGRASRVILVTGHRRESFGPALRSICSALAEISLRHPDVHVIYPVHLNPNVRGPVHELLGGSDRIHLLPPLDYVSFVDLMRRCELILTDSGGVQEEGAALGRPVLVMRDTTERPEAVREGNLRLVGTATRAIVAETEHLLRNPFDRERMSRPSVAYGDGHASERIARVLRSMAG